MYGYPIKKIVILGGGTAGWMAAAALSEKYRDRDLDIKVVESPDIASVGVGEATVPGIRLLHQQLKISEWDFIRATGATFKLGIEFEDWRSIGSRFFHPFSDFGMTVAGKEFYQCWLKLHKEGKHFALEDFCLSLRMAKSGRFAQPDESATSHLALYNYAYHFDASSYAKFLRDYAEKRRATRISATVVDTRQDEKTGFLTSLGLSDGTSLEGDLFIDCSGFRGLLIDKCMSVPFKDWSRYLPCDSAVVVQSKNVGEVLPYTISKALEAGWQWRIPLEHRTGNGYVYSSRHIDDDSAKHTLLNNIEGEPVNEPRKLRFKAGMRERFWEKNCVALGLASGFLEPLESTSISLIQTGIDKIMQFIPDLRLEKRNIVEANRLNRLEYERVRDFLVLHYISSERTDSEFWCSFRNSAIPGTLQRKLAAFEEDGTLLMYGQETFLEASWIAMHNGFGRIPRKIKEDIAGTDTEKLSRTLQKMQTAISEAATFAPPHTEFLQGVYARDS